MAEIVLSDEVRMVVLQLSFTNANALPLWVRDAEAEKVQAAKARKARHTGRLVVSPVERVSLAELARGLEAAGYKLVDAFKQCRVDPQKMQSYWSVRFVFALERLEDFDHRNAIRGELQKLLDQAYWRVRIFLNPFYQNGEEVPGYQALSVNLEARVPVLDRNGKSILARERNAQSNKAGEPVPLSPDFEALVHDNMIEIVPSA